MANVENNITKIGLKELREISGLTQQQVADGIGIQQCRYSRLENTKISKKNWNMELLTKITNFYGLNSLSEGMALIHGKYETTNVRC